MQNNIKLFRDKLRMTQQELADKADITRPYLSDIENNKKKPGAIIAMKIAKALNARVEDIFFTENVHHSKRVRTTS